MLFDMMLNTIQFIDFLFSNLSYIALYTLIHGTAMRYNGRRGEVHDSLQAQTKCRNRNV